MQPIINPGAYINKSNSYLLLKIGIAALCAVFLFRRTADIDLSEFGSLFKNNLQTNWMILIVAGSLIFVNWGIETVKWRFLISHIEQLSFIKAFSAVLAGVTISSFTPNRVGEFAGRMMFLKDKFDSRVVALTIIGSMSQLMITLIIGLPGFLLYLANAGTDGVISGKWSPLIFLTLPLLYILIFWNLPSIFRGIKNRFKSNKKVDHIIAGAGFLNRSGLLYISILSFARYLVFAIQFVLILWFFDVDINGWQCMVFIPAIFFIQSVIPSFAITEIGVRITVAVSVLAFTKAPESSIIAASSLLWVINLMIPAIFGVFALLSTKLSYRQ